MVRSILLSFLFIIAQNVLAQESKLAQQYFKDGEYEKSASLYKKLYEKNVRNDYYFKYYFNSLVKLSDYEEAEKAIRKAIRKRPKDTYLLVRQASLYEMQGDSKKAESLYEKAIKKLENNRSQVILMANDFNALKKYDYALRVYEKAVDMNKNESMFAVNMANLYLQTGDNRKMIKYYLIYGKKDKNTSDYVKRVLQHRLSDSLSLVLKEELYVKMQEEPEEPMYIDMLSWLFVQQKEYSKALRQLIALDRRLEEDGVRVYSLATTAENDKDYKTAIKAYRYIVEEKSSNSAFFLNSKISLLRCMKEQVDLSAEHVPEEDLLNIEKGYEDALNELGVNDRTAYLSIEYAHFEAYYMNKLDRAIEILLELVGRTRLDDRVKAEAKLDLGDYYLMIGEIWEGSLLYSQVDKTFQEGYLGELARYKNAKLSYFNGDFEWSKIQLDVLKPSTSKLISNDAIDLSVFISENMGLDSTTIPLQLFAGAELKAIQHKYDEAFARLDSVVFLYPDHELEDDVWYVKGKIHAERKDFAKAAEYYNKVIEKHADNIRGDNAMFALAGLYEHQLNQPEKALELYEKLFIDYSSSTFAIEARKRYRFLSPGNRKINNETMSPEDRFMRGYPAFPDSEQEENKGSN